MAGLDDAATLTERFRAHAALCSAPLYQVLMASMADDLDAGGPVADVVEGWHDAPPGAMVQLRLLAGLHRIVLRREAAELATYYRTAGGDGAAEDAWEAARSVIAANVSELRTALHVAPQTNEVGRSAPLVVALMAATRRSGLPRVQLLEVGASAGLNLLVDRYRVSGEGWVWGPAASPVQLADAVVGAVEPHPVTITRRRGCDLLPVDATTASGRLLLSSFVWPDHVDRFERLGAALRVAADHPVRVEPGSAGQWLEQVLAEPVPSDVLTVVWHSISRLYWTAEEADRVDAAIAEATARTPLAHAQMEAGSQPQALLSLDVWRHGERMAGPQVLGDVADHGVPVRLR